MSTTTLQKNIIVKIGGFTNGMTIQDVMERAKHIADFYDPIRNQIYAFTWDGDPFKRKGSILDEARGTPACFTHAMGFLKNHFPEIPWIAAKRIDQLGKLESTYIHTTKHGSVEVGCEDIFGPIHVLAEMTDVDAKELQVGCLNVLAAPADIHWAKLGVESMLWHIKRGFKVHYVTIGGGRVVTKELEEVGEHLDLLWRLPTSRLSPVEGKAPDVVEFQFISKEPTLELCYGKNLVTDTI